MPAESYPQQFQSTMQRKENQASRPEGHRRGSGSSAFAQWGCGAAAAARTRAAKGRETRSISKPAAEPTTSTPRTLSAAARATSSTRTTARATPSAPPADPASASKEEGSAARGSEEGSAAAASADAAAAAADTGIGMEGAAAAAASEGSPLVVVEDSPTTTLQVRLADGSRTTVRANKSHTLEALHAHIASLTPGVAFSLRAGFPPKRLGELGRTLEEAGLLNEAITQSKE
mmetsp:Transcript_13046/g.43416  ORF Transcript_13046/g.43416 Transcript_13046/m.43416 type:complete len:232 (-) Transcript_13046:45-740(-)